MIQDVIDFNLIKCYIVIGLFYINRYCRKMWIDKEKQDKYYPAVYELYGKNIFDEESKYKIIKV